MLDLDHVEALIRNPASASPDRDMLLALVAECRRLRAMECACGCNKLREGEAHISGAAKALTEAPIMEIVATQHFGALDSKPPSVVETHEKPKRGKK